ncbi:hypothetical protein COO91_02093 [Nostoc flagelliforme CCNUN1]|uniref:Uncharacterized protein n=1 Tax=Nostoc flagelliforme CCNUN1 TaxID=2038116 RepID=A0A2K8SL71_9NOSO|nr:hypothetical protein COO91_02093 [Nostoc flagelliforme CCNUN1]
MIFFSRLKKGEHPNASKFTKMVTSQLRMKRKVNGIDRLTR